MQGLSRGWRTGFSNSPGWVHRRPKKTLKSSECSVSLRVCSANATVRNRVLLKTDVVCLKCIRLPLCRFAAQIKGKENENPLLAALPVFNEANSVDSVLDEVSKYAENVLVVNVGSTDGTAEKLGQRSDIDVVHHQENRGYGAALKTAFQYAIDNQYEIVVTLDCDGQHQPKRIPRFVAACAQADIVSGSRYLKKYEGDSVPPAQRMFINKQITRQLNERFHFV